MVRTLSCFKGESEFYLPSVIQYIIKKEWNYGIGVDLFKKEELISFWTKFIKVITFTFILEIIFLLRLCQMFEHIHIFFFLHNSKEES